MIMMMVVQTKNLPGKHTSDTLSNSHTRNEHAIKVIKFWHSRGEANYDNILFNPALLKAGFDSNEVRIVVLKWDHGDTEPRMHVTT